MYVCISPRMYVYFTIRAGDIHLYIHTYIHLILFDSYALCEDFNNYYTSVCKLASSSSRMECTKLCITRNDDLEEHPLNTINPKGGWMAPCVRVKCYGHTQREGGGRETEREKFKDADHSPQKGEGGREQTHSVGPLLRSTAETRDSVV